MVSIKIGDIREIKNYKQKWYEVSLLEGTRSATFDNIENAIKYVRKYALIIFKSRNLISLHMKYLHFNGNEHYLLFQKDSTGEIVFFEETKFDFLRTHPQKRTKYRLRRAINEKNYSFSDVFRITINWHPFFSIWNSIILFFILASSGLFLVYGLHYFSDINSKFEMEYKVMLLLAFFIGLITIFLISIFHFKTRFTLLQVSGDFKEIDWHKWYLIRISQLVISIFFASISLTVIILLLKEAFNSNLEFKIVLIINLSFWLLNLISSVTMLMYSYHKRASMLKKYFTKKEHKLFKKWLKDPESKEVWKHKNIFIFDDKFSDNLTRKAIDETIEKLKLTSPADLKKIRQHENMIKNELIANYNNYVEGDDYDDIHENN